MKTGLLRNGCGFYRVGKPIFLANLRLYRINIYTLYTSMKSVAGLI